MKITLSVACLISLAALIMPLHAQNRLELRLPWAAKSSFTLTVYPGKQVFLVTENGDLRIDYGDGKGALPITHVDRDEALNEEIGLIFDDFNFDGFEDFAVNDNGYGYMGVNMNNSVYAYDVRSGKFNKILDTTNIAVDRKNKRLISAARSGPRWYRTIYKFIDGRPYEYKSSVSIGADLEKVTIKAPDGKVVEKLIVDIADESGSLKPAMRKISARRAYLYPQPDETIKPGAYLIAGDKVEILDSAGEWDEWFKIRFQGKKTLLRWIKSDSISEQ